MAWRYEQRTGKLTDEDGYLWGIGYSGLGNAKNAPEFQNVHDVGPIPQGWGQRLNMIASSLALAGITTPSMHAFWITHPQRWRLDSLPYSSQS